jgi:RsiW-degrading membrane proteinase PrsW (M82 family)
LTQSCSPNSHAPITHVVFHSFHVAAAAAVVVVVVVVVVVALLRFIGEAAAPRRASKARTAL